MRRLIIFLSAICCSMSLIFSNAFGACTPYSLSIQTGLSKLRVGDSTVQTTPIETDTLHQQENPWTPEYSVGASYSLPLNSPYQYHSFHFFSMMRFALNLRYLNQDIAGEVYQFQIPSMNNYNYTLSTETLRLVLNAFLTIFTFKENVSLYILGGVGNAWSRVDYDDLPITGVIGGALNLNSRINTGLTYEAGLGVMWPFEKNLAFFLEYRYAHLPSIKLANSGSLNGLQTTLPSATFPYSSQTLSLGINWNI